MIRSATAARRAISRYASRRFARKFDRLRRYQAIEPLLERIESIRPLAGARVVELGAGTGVLTEALARRARQVVACDRSASMLALNRRNLALRGIGNVEIVQADHRALPLPASSADVLIAAFAFDALVYDVPETTWRAELDRAIEEMMRLSAEGAVAIVAGTPHGARDMGFHLESNWGLARLVFFTRWRFPGRWRARAAVKMFFGERVWLDYRSHWPKALVTPAVLWWGAAPRLPRQLCPNHLLTAARTSARRPTPACSCA